MGRKGVWVGVVLLALLAYGAGPLWAAWDLRQAVKLADRERLRGRVAWLELRQNLKARVVERSQNGDVKGGWLKKQATRVFAPAVADQTIDLVVTPERLGWLLKRRLDWRAFRGSEPDRRRPTSSPGLTDEDDDPLALEPRRLKWMFFDSPTTFRVEVRDKKDPSRTLVAVLGLRGFGWQLIDVDRL